MKLTLNKLLIVMALLLTSMPIVAWINYVHSPLTTTENLITTIIMHIGCWCVAGLDILFITRRQTPVDPEKKLKKRQVDNAIKWLEALVSGKYKQGKNWLMTGPPGDRKYCCLGVGYDVLHPGKYSDQASLNFFQDHEALGLNGNYGDYCGKEQMPSCISLNDNSGKSFIEIAQQLLKYEGYWQNPELHAMIIKRAKRSRSLRKLIIKNH